MLRRNILRKSTNMQWDVYQPLEEDTNVSGFTGQRYELLPGWWEDTDNSPKIHPKVGADIGYCHDGGFSTIWICADGHVPLKIQASELFQVK